PSVSSIRRSRRRKDSLDARSAWEWLDDEPAEPVGPRRRGAEGEGRGGRGLAVLFLLALLRGGGYLAYRHVYLPRLGGAAPPLPPPRTCRAGGPPRRPPRRPPAPPPPPKTPRRRPSSGANLRSSAPPRCCAPTPGPRRPPARQPSPTTTRPARRRWRAGWRPG